MPRTEKQLARYKNPDNDPRNPWTSSEYVSSKSKEERPTLWYSINHPKTGIEVWPDESAVWRYTKEKHEELEKDGRLYWGPNQCYEKPRIKRYLSEIQNGLVPSTWWDFKDSKHNDEGQKETAKLIGKKIFSAPKHKRLIEKILRISTKETDILVDFFSGSCPTAQAVLDLNKEDSGKRKFIMVQLPEPCEENTEAYKAGYSTIAEIGKERIRRVISKITEENPEYQGDLGFEVFKLDSSNIKPWDVDADNLEQSLLNLVENIKPEGSEQNVLYEILLKYGLDLTIPIEERTIGGKKVYVIGSGALVLCMDRNVSLEVVEGIAALKDELQPELMRVVFRDRGFQDDVVKTNAVQILRQNGIEDVRSL